ncbi:glucose-6-phosphate dehydrogenase [Pseudoduganella albidiflava]|uniref:Glucose-6-phosphate 1-dehydrogenase n=1 Tax=Pseudoduganella albidiflava TaxID=321983 RepID=A0A411WTZ3_9BURK|nr:glucose-6-phosphate dehydrogenase [Pseudoduganella albidiflava]QBI00233.1 glucose-6-phosphate dehydrogenase [Pseudoduganella albidiflava]GGY52307.1 glucose-6-phosphate 1-dehydrogenase [Pseudoduganella albidiflava]
MALSDFDLVLFGGSGDLAMRKLLPAMFSRDVCGDLPPTARIVCVGRHENTTEEFIDMVNTTSRPHIKTPKVTAENWEKFTRRIVYVAVDAADPSSYRGLADALRPDAGLTRVYYLATPPALFAQICDNLKENGLVTPASRVVLEKPLGRDLASAKQINREVGEVFEESQIYRIDHYLGKETVQNLLALRFGNILFEPLWRREWISDVQITIAEKLGVGNRIGYYDTSGALRDMLQNHLLQLLCIVAMEPPASTSPDAVRDAKLQVLRSLKRFTPTTLAQNIVRGQYRAGHVDGQAVPSYRDEPDAPQGSRTETFVAMKAEIDTWRWAGVPFYLRTGKRMADGLAEIVVRFKQIPHSIFQQPTSSFQPNSLVIRLQPDEGLRMNLMAKTPGEGMRLKPAELELDFRESFKAPRMDAYERLLLDVLRGQLTLFMRGDELEAAWEWVEPILTNWEQDDTAPLPYSSGTWGPAASSALIGRDGLQWREEALPED